MGTLSLEKDRIRILLLENIAASAVEAFREVGYTNVERRSGTLPEAELKDALQGVHFLGIRSRTQLTREVFAAADRLVGVGAFCIGTNQIYLEAASEHGVAVFNAPFSNTRSVAELVMAEAILLLRGVPRRNMRAHRGVWDKSAADANEIRGKCLGIVGYGNIGAQLSVMAEALGMHVLFHDVEKKLPLGNATPVDSLADLLEKADIVSLHVPDTPATRGMIGKEELKAMKPDAVLLNASRGTVVDLEALEEALRSGHLRGAAIDVYPNEPASRDDPLEAPLQGLENVVLTPHIGGATVEAQHSIGREVAEKLIRYSDNGSTATSVNFPEVTLPPHPGMHRLLHVHKNRPGVMEAINAAFARQNVNVAAQYLQTRGRLGYVVMDIDTDDSEAALAELRDVPGTLRARVLF